MMGMKMKIKIETYWMVMEERARTLMTKCNRGYPNEQTEENTKEEGE